MSLEHENTPEQEESLELCFAQLEELIADLEQSDITLEEAFFTYEKGMKKLKQCNDKIERVEKQMLVLNEQGDLETQ